MRNYRKAFLFALAGNVVFLTMLAGLWWWSARKSSIKQHPSGAEPSSAMQPAQTGASVSAPPPTETPLAPVQLSPERLQSIGVMFGTVERKSVQD